MQRRFTTAPLLLLCLLSAGATAQEADANGGPPAVSEAARLLESAWRQVDLVNFPAAQKTFTAVAEANPTRAQQAEALYGLGHLWQHRRPGPDVALARQRYKEAGEQFANTPVAPLAWMALARLADAPKYEKERDRDEARRLYAKIISDYPGTPTFHEARLRLAMTFFEDLTDSAAEDRGVAMLADHIRAHPNNYLAVAMHSQLAEVHQRRGRTKESVEHWIAADAVDVEAAEAQLTPADRKLTGRRLLNRIGQHRVMDSSARASLYFRVAQLAEKRLEDYPLAVRFYERIVYEVVRDNKYFVSKLRAEHCRKLAKQAGVDIPPHPLADEADEADRAGADDSTEAGS